MNNVLMILNDPPYGTERSYNGLRLAKAVSNEDTHVAVFLLLVQKEVKRCLKAFIVLS